MRIPCARAKYCSVRRSRLPGARMGIGRGGGSDSSALLTSTSSSSSEVNGGVLMGVRDDTEDDAEGALCGRSGQKCMF